jgi:tetratricopeptide (TPR) repeat protein
MPIPIEINPKNPNPYLYISEIYLEKKQYKKTLKLYQRANKIIPNNLTAS